MSEEKKRKFVVTVRLQVDVAIRVEAEDSEAAEKAAWLAGDDLIMGLETNTVTVLDSELELCGGEEVEDDE